MSLVVAGAQTGPIQRADSRAGTLDRLIALLEQAARAGAQLVVFPELALTTFFPRWLLEGAELDAFYEREMPGPATQRLFDRARELRVGFYLGYAELTPDGHRFNTAITVGPDGAVLGKYRKVHLPGSAEPRPAQSHQQLEKRYFEYGDGGFQAFRGAAAWGAPVMGMLICNDRRWPEAWRCYALQGTELMVLGYNSAAYDPNGGNAEDLQIRTFHSILSAQANAYFNATFAVAVAKAGVEDGAGLIGGSVIVDPNGMILAQAATLDDEVIVAECDFGRIAQGRGPGKIFDFGFHRRPQHYTRIVEQTGIEVIP
ncbi:MAG: N-carbamoyl-D-amino-acid hydrolase [Rubritepida sp.]|nr:N-carbamoyl-D-amino-acid hydrolase [Rubritepida sp.]